MTCDGNVVTLRRMLNVLRIDVIWPLETNESAPTSVPSSKRTS